jgi:RsiW-degrading membrane proteinase PrsW (M82 family)
MGPFDLAVISADIVVLSITIALASLPVFFLLWYFNHRDKGEKEPKKLRKKIFRWGVAVTFAAALIEAAIEFPVYDFFNGNPPLAYLMLMPFLVVALTEESLKYWVVKKFAYDHEKFNEVMDGITYCIIASMGFAVLENIIYTLQYGWGTGVLRAFTAVPAHALFSGIMGHYMGIAKFTKTPEQVNRLLRRGLAAGILFHGLYNFLLMSGIPILMIMVFPLLAYMAVILNHAIRMANKGDMTPIRYI